MTRRLDEARPFGEVIGKPGIHFEQDGLLFNSNRLAVDGEGHVLDLPETEKPANAPKDYDAMHWKHLKPLVEMYGGTWTNKEDAVAFLRGKTSDVVG